LYVIFNYLFNKPGYPDKMAEINLGVMIAVEYAGLTDGIDTF